MLHLINRGGVKDARDGVALTDAQLKDEFNPCGAVCPNPDFLRGDDRRIFCTHSGRNHAGPHKVLAFGNRWYEWSNEAQS